MNLGKFNCTYVQVDFITLSVVTEAFHNRNWLLFLCMPLAVDCTWFRLLKQMILFYRFKLSVVARLSSDFIWVQCKWLICLSPCRKHQNVRTITCFYEIAKTYDDVDLDVDLEKTQTG